MIENHTKISESTDRLLLLEITIDDLNNIHYLNSTSEVDRYNTLGIPKDIEETKLYINNIIEAQNKSPRGSYTLKIIEKNTKQFIGVAGISVSNDRFRLGEIFYNLFPEFWGNGYATEVSKKLITLGFEKFNLHKVEAGVSTENIRSINVLEKIGMTREGLRRKILPIRGEWKDNYHYAIVEDDTRDY